jgi:putative restriction endonuclease
MIEFTDIIIGKEYDRPTLAAMWGYQTFHAISRGVVTPRGQKLIVLFVTKEKQETLTQYEDHIDLDILFWEGEKEHRSDARIVSRKDLIHVFFRERHHSSFVYVGQADLRTYKLYADRPSKFSFQLIDRAVSDESIVEEVQQTYGLTETEKEAIIKSRRGQGLYRSRALELWKSCSLSGFSKQTILVASHIKPWKVSTNEERLNPHNSLLLVPTLDKLFDKGYVGFAPGGNIMLSDKIEQNDWRKIGLDSSARLRTVPPGTKEFLIYHREYIFDLVGK